MNIQALFEFQKKIQCGNVSSLFSPRAQTTGDREQEEGLGGTHLALGVGLGAAVEQQPGGRGVAIAGGEVEGSQDQWLGAGVSEVNPRFSRCWGIISQNSSDLLHIWSAAT